MKIKTSLLIFGFATTGFALHPAQAQDESLQVDSEAQDESLQVDSGPIMPEALISEPVYNEIELGIGFVSDDAYKFGRYNDLESKGAFFVGNFEFKDFDKDGSYGSFHITNFLQESRYLHIEAGLPGSYKLFLEYDGLPNYKNDTVKTPFAGIGSDNLTLPPSFDIDSNLYDNLNKFELKTKRERLSVGASFVPKKRWQFDISFSHEDKQGVDATGSAMANGSDQLLGFTTIALLPEPIDYNTDLVNATLRYDGNDGQLDFTYHMSLFTNADEALTWQDPFNPGSAIGSMSLAPDNEFHQLSLAGVYTLPYNSQLTGLFSMGRMTQNQDFQPYTVNLTSPALPRTSLDGEVWLTTAQLKLTSRPVRALRLNAELRYNERSNQTPINTYNYIVMDSHSGGPIDNNPYSYKNSKLKLDANYRFNAITSLRIGYKYNDMKRSYTNVERENTEENSLFAKWKVKPHSTVDLALYAEAGSRNGSDYNTLGQNPGLRKFHLADRDRLQMGAKIDYMATDKLFLSLRTDFNKDDYSDTDIGLIESVQPVYTVDFTYQPRNNISTYGYYTYERIESSQAGYDISAAATNDWAADFDDIFNTLGIGARLNDLGKWDVGLDVVYSQSTGKIKMTDYVLAGTEEQFPDNKTELTSVKLWTNYNYDKELTYRLGLGYEDYTEDNWAVDGLLPYDQATVANTLLLGNEALDYDTYVITVSVSYKFK